MTNKLNVTFEIETTKTARRVRHMVEEVSKGEPWSILTDQQTEWIENADSFGISHMYSNDYSSTYRVTCRFKDTDDSTDSPSEWFGDVADRIEDRDDVHEDSFSEIADLWSTYLNEGVDESDVANLMVLLKVARNANGVYEADNYTDIAGYAYWGDRKEDTDE